MSFYFPPWNSDIEPNQGNIRQWLDNLYAKFQPYEQARWNESNIDYMFWAGAQTFVNRYFNNPQANNNQQFYFNIIQPLVQLVTGYQRQHRKSLTFVPFEGADTDTTDQYTRMIMHVCNTQGLHETFSRACEASAIGGLCLLMPYLDYTGCDPAQGEMKMKLWEFNSFIADPFAREYDYSDARFVWCQEYISKKEAEDRFPDKMDVIVGMSGTPQRFGNFYFLPENHNMSRNDLLVLSYVWYKWKTKRKKLYSASRNQFFDFAQDNENLEEVLYSIPDLEVVEVDVPCWKVAVVLNDQLMFQGDDPTGGTKCPFIPVMWNYDPYLPYADLRVRSMVRPTRTCQYLFNHKIINNNDISEATINAGWKRKVGAVANEDNLKKSGQGYDIIVNEGYELSDIEKIIPTGVPESDLALAEQMGELVNRVTGIQLENWSAQDDKQASTLTTMIKQAANLTVFQKYFDQWDQSWKLCGERMMEIILNNWNASKVGLMLGEEPTAYFYSKIFVNYQTTVQEGLLTPTQKNYQAQQMMEINASFGREVIPPSMIIKDMNIQGKAEILEFLQKQEEAASQQQSDAEMVAHAIEDAKLKELYTKSVANIARAREDHSRSESNLGLFEERLSMIERNRALSLKEKQAALTSLLENMQRFGQIETEYADNKLAVDAYGVRTNEEMEKQDVERRTEANKFLEQILGQMSVHPKGAPGQQQQGNPQEQMMPGI